MTRFFDGVGHGLAEAFAMFWATLWALILGFLLSGAVQAFVRRDEMRKALGDHGPRSIGKATFFGMVSSSCSYASSALARSLFLRGADFTASMVFMIASTNLVIELGIVLWLLMGWQFTVAEFIGGFLMIGLLSALLPRVVTPQLLETTPAETGDDDHTHGHAHEDEHTHHHGTDESTLEQIGILPRLRDAERRRAAFGYTLGDLTMIRTELVFGFLVAGFLAALVPTDAWQALFLTKHGIVGELENVVLGPLLAIISFVCSVGNVPLAAALWHGGISFGGVISFVFADLITLPLLLIYRRYYGTPVTLRILGTFWLTMSSAGLAVDYMFRALDITFPSRELRMVEDGVQLNYTTVLNIVAVAAFVTLYLLSRRGRTDQAETSRFAIDPVCGMQVEKANAPAVATIGDTTYWFCSPHCAQRYQGTKGRPVAAPGRATMLPMATPQGATMLPMATPQGATMLPMAAPVPPDQHGKDCCH